VTYWSPFNSKNHKNRVFLILFLIFISTTTFGVRAQVDWVFQKLESNWFHVVQSTHILKFHRLLKLNVLYKHHCKNTGIHTWNKDGKESIHYFITGRLPTKLLFMMIIGHLSRINVRPGDTIDYAVRIKIPD
jgi:hypothetical protein